jgi:hypothetical protein
MWPLLLHYYVGFFSSRFFTFKTKYFYHNRTQSHSFAGYNKGRHEEGPFAQ